MRRAQITRRDALAIAGGGGAFAALTPAACGNPLPDTAPPAGDPVRWRGDRLAPPADFGWTPRIGIVRTGRDRFDTVGGADALRPGGAVRQLHVDTLGGSDGGDGSEARPFRSVGHAIAWDGPGVDTIEVLVVPPPDRIIWGNLGPANACPRLNLILRARDGGELIFVGAGMPDPPAFMQAAPVWTPRGDGTFATPLPPGAHPLSLPLDLRPEVRATMPGRAPRAFLPAPDAATVARNPGTSVVDAAAGLCIVHPHDGRDLAGDGWVTRPTANKSYTVNHSQVAGAPRPGVGWFSRILAIGGAAPIGGNNHSDVRTTMVLDRCGMFGGWANGLAVTGGIDVYTFDCAGGWCGNDVFNTHGYGADGPQARALHVRPLVAVRTGFDGSHSSNCITGHDDNRAIVVMPDVRGSDGRVLGYINRSRVIVLGGTIGPAGTDNQRYSAGVNAGGTARVDLVGVKVAPSPGPFAFTTDAGARIVLHDMPEAAGLSRNHPESISPSPT